MSPAAVAGHPPTSSAPLGGGRPAGGPSNQNGSKAGARVYPHIDDLVSVKPDVDIHAPLRRLLQQADLNIRQADTQLEFRRPDIALQEYIKASIIAVELVPRHKDYPSLQADRGDLHRLFVGLKKRINGLHARFEEVKAIIKENNVQSGIQPKVQRNGGATNGTAGGFSAPPELSAALPAGSRSSVSGARTLQSGESVSQVDTSKSASSNSSYYSASPLVVEKRRPPVQPKPRELQGASIQSPPSSPRKSTGHEEDLLSRFARLRSTASNSSAGGSTPLQDPRIRTRPIVIPDEPTPRRDSSSPSRQKFEADKRQFISSSLGQVEFPSVPSGFPGVATPEFKGAVPRMPRAPDAIYSPAKVSVELEPQDQPQSTTAKPYGLLRRQSSMASMADSNHADSVMAVTSFLDQGLDSMTADVLRGVLKRKEYSILLVDIRSREDFDSGHIMWQNILCLEPIGLKPDISAQNIEDSAVLSPDLEQRLFNERNKFTVIVYYDQDSKTRPNDTDHPLRNFWRALRYDAEKPLQRRPILLEGGLDAWIDLVGPGALQTSNTGVSTGPKRSIKSRDALSYRQNYINARRYTSRSLSAKEEKEWADKLREDEANAAKAKASIEGQYVKSTEDFLRRFPDPTSIKESMSGPAAPTSHEPQPYELDTNAHDSSMPPIPARPAPAVPRRSYSGVSTRNDNGPSTPGLGGLPGSDLSAPPGIVRGNTGLANPANNNACYMNSIIQCLSGTRELRKHLLDGEYKLKGPPPRKGKETTDPPQLLVQSLAQLFKHLWSGVSQFSPTRFEQYIYSIHRGQGTPSEDLFASRRQQDAVAYLLFLLDVLADELNYRRDRPSLPPLTTLEENRLMELPLFTGSYTSWLRHLSVDDSFIMNLFKVLTCTIRECKNCHRYAKNWDVSPLLQMRPGIDRNNEPQHLEDDFRARFGGRPTSTMEAKCDGCKVTTEQPSVEKVIRCPNILVIQIARFINAYGALQPRKNERLVRIPLQLDMTPYVASFKPEDKVQAHQLPPQFQPPFKYELYAVVQHEGTLNGGHYWTLRKGDNNTWWRFDDARVTRTVESEIQKASSYVLFYQRTPYPL